MAVPEPARTKPSQLTTGRPDPQRAPLDTAVTFLIWDGKNEKGGYVSVGTVGVLAQTSR